MANSRRVISSMSISGVLTVLKSSDVTSSVDYWGKEDLLTAISPRILKADREQQQKWCSRMSYDLIELDFDLQMRSNYTRHCIIPM